MPEICLSQVFFVYLLQNINIMGKLKTLDEYKEDVKRLWGDKLTVADDAIYLGNKKKIKMICYKHGEQMLRPNNVILGSGCRECGYEKVSKKNSDSPETFVEKAIKRHGNEKFDYSLAIKEYGKQKKVHIICKTCGRMFEQMPSLHISGNGCPHCNPFPKKYTTETIGEHIKTLHPDIEILSEYNGNNDSKIIVRCKKHNYEWETTAHRLHQQKHACKYCYQENRKEEIRKKEEKKFKEFTDIYYKPLYDTSKIKYINSKKKVTLICPEHGEFMLTPNKMKNRLDGCPYCNESVLERKIRLFLINNNINFERQKSFDWLINKGKMHLDFYLPNYNIAIECQGEQHVIDRESIMNKRDSFSSKVERDVLKNKLCVEHEIKILYVFNKIHSSNRLNEMFNHMYDEALFIEDIENDNSILFNKIKKLNEVQ